MADRVYDQTDVDALREWLDSNQDSASEKLVGRLEDRIAQDYPALRVLATNSAMAGLHLALQIIGVGPGDEVVVDPIVVFAGMAALFQHATPVFADVDAETLNIDPASVQARITPRTKAIICTHHFGSVCDMEGLLGVAREHGLPVVEDCAHALFATRSETYAGLFGDFAAFSFNHRKQLSTGQGGFLLVNREDYAERATDRGFGRVPARLSWNYQMPGLVAALALTQWERAKAYVHRDAELAQLYTDAVAGCDWLTPQRIPAENWCAYHIWAATYTGDEAGIEYDRFMAELRERGGDYFLPSFMPYGAFGLEPSPVYRYPLFTEPLGPNDGACPRAEYLVPRMFNTVLSPVEDERIERYASALHDTIAHFS